MKNIQHSTSNVQPSMIGRWRFARQWVSDVGRWMLDVPARRFSRFILPLLFAPMVLFAQSQPQISPNALRQIQTARPPVDVSTSPTTASSEFDPPVVRTGEKTFYRVTVDATESSIQWPDKIAAPLKLKFGPDARGQITEYAGNKFHPTTSFVYEMRPTTTGHFVITNFTVSVYGKPLEVPAVSLEVEPQNASPAPAARQLTLETSATNVFIGQPFHVSVILPAEGKQVAALREVQINGDGFMTGRTAVRQSVETIPLEGRLTPAFIYETTVTPIAAGPLNLSAQAFTAGREFRGPIMIHGHVTISGGPPKFVLLESDLISINVRPLPSTGRLPGFTGAIGKFFLDPPRLSTNRLRVGEPVRLNVTIHGEGDLTRLTPPATPHSRNWQIIADEPPDIGYTLIPLTDETRETPAIPFSYFDPTTAKYVDLTIPSLPITVTGESLPTELTAFDETPTSGAPTKLSGLAPTPGQTATSLQPLQLHAWFVGLQLTPVFCFLGLWQWDRRRRFLEAHPEIVRRRKAKRALRRERYKLQQAVAGHDTTAFTRHAANAMKIACAPHFPAHPQALVCSDVLVQLDGTALNSRVGETVRKIFAAADAQFAATPSSPADLSAMQADVDVVLLKLEEKL